MSTLFKAMSTNDARTTNGMVTNSTSSNAVLDMFFKLGGSRLMDEASIERIFVNAFRENPELALKAMFYNRDIRGGQGERRSFKIAFRWLCFVEPDVARKMLQFVPIYGRWDDLLIGLRSKVTPYIADFILSAIKNGDRLCAKWMPRENKHGHEDARMLMTIWGMTPKQYRKMLAGNTDVVETLMCKNLWPKINYNHVPSKASHKYRDAFLKQDEARYREWLGNLSKVDERGVPLAKVNAGAIFPHEVVDPYFKGGRESAMVEAQWKALPNYGTESNRVLTVCDTSGSMTTGGGLPIRVCVALGMYTAERNTGIFKDSFITFSRRPELQRLTGKTLYERYNQLAHAYWEGNTDLEAVFRLILRSAVKGLVPEADMPDTILIISDMQFDSCVISSSDSALDMIKREYRDAGYTVPNVVFWNVATSNGVPAKYDSRGTALVSGFSPSILGSILGGNMTPENQMLAVLNSERYLPIKI